MTVEFTIYARPSSRKESIELDDDGTTIVVHVTDAAERGRANKAIVKLLAKFLSVSTASMAIIQGSTSSTKRVRVDGMDAADFDARIQNLASTS